MSRIDLVGVDGSNPLGFLAALGLLRVVSIVRPEAKLGFADDGSFRLFLDAAARRIEIAAIVDRDAKAQEGAPPWLLSYEKTEKNRKIVVADLKPPPATFRRFLATCLDQWLNGEDELASYAAAFGTDVAVDRKGNTKPSAFHFTAANQQFLGAVEGIRASLSLKWIATALFRGNCSRPGSNLRWDPGAERNWALMANNPNDDGTQVNAPLEWLAFRGLPLLPSFPRGTRIITTGVSGRGDDMVFAWPLWSVPASLQTVRSALQLDWDRPASERFARGIFAICSSAIRRTGQGFGNFGPSSVTC